MKKIKFTNEEIELLSKDPRIKHVDPYSIRFTLEFRQQLYDEVYPNFNILSKMVNDKFNDIKNNIKTFTCSQRKTICTMINDISKMDNCYYKIRDLLNKVGISKTSYYSILKN